MSNGVHTFGPVETNGLFQESAQVCFFSFTIVHTLKCQEWIVYSRDDKEIHSVTELAKKNYWKSSLKDLKMNQ